jgi:hypothetical protein
MAYDDDEPELAGYQPHDRPLRSPHLKTVMRVVVVVGLIGLLLPGILVTLSTASRTATVACSIYTAYYAPEAVSFSARFEVVSAAGMGWNCYAVDYGGDELLVRSLGIIPGAVTVPRIPTEDT